MMVRRNNRCIFQMTPSMKVKLHVQNGLSFEDGNVLQAQALYAKLPGYQVPIGFIWYSQILVSVVNLHYIFVNEKFRRQGIADAMLVELRDWYPKATIVTAVSNELSEPWLLKNGFLKEHDGWWLRNSKTV